MTQTNSASEKPRSARIDGRATLTIVTSSTAIRTPRQTTPRASQRAEAELGRVTAPIVAKASEGALHVEADAAAAHLHRDAVVAGQTQPAADEDARRRRLPFQADALGGRRGRAVGAGARD